MSQHIDRKRQPLELLTRISHALVGYSSIYINTVWGEAALAAYDEIQPIRHQMPPDAAERPKRRKARRLRG